VRARRVLALAFLPAIGAPAARADPTPRPHWAFQPVERPAVPAVRDASWPQSDIDRFILAKLESLGLEPSPPADRRTLLRRAHFDLTGLPPTADELAAFERDDSATAFADVVERLLASPHHGERWGRHWMDVVRYADTAGDNADYPVPEARLYRDYIIDAFNADKPYDQFVREQLAGDILAARGPPDRYAESVTATGFLALSRRYATAPFEFHHLTIEDAIETTGRTFLGMTFRCARCHDHKYDPVTREDYYALYGFFESTRFPYAGSEEFQSKGFPRSGFHALLPPAECAPLVEAHEKRLAALEADIERSKKGLAAAEKEPDKKRDLEARLKALGAEKTALGRAGAPAGLPVAYAVGEGKPVDSRLQPRGEPDELGPVVRRRAPGCLAGDEPLDIPDGSSGRLELARWLTRPENPLTTRVMVNRIWQHHFGKGLVATPSNFGLRGNPPTHPELLDHLAAVFVESGWSVKAMHRLIVSSRTWQQSSAHRAASAAIDPANRWYWRQDRRRLDAEALRDTMLSIAGTLDPRRPGPHPFPPIAEWQWTQHSPFKAAYESRHRSVYLMTQRIQRHPYLALFDAPDANVSTDLRADSTVPLQALHLMNDPFVREQASAFARRVMEARGDDADRVWLACLTAWSRDPGPEEIERARRFLAEARDELRRAGVTGTEMEAEAWAGYARVLLASSELFYVD
jgi:hypothetical protein